MKNDSQENWRPIEGHELFEVSDQGNVYSHKTDRILRPYNRNGKKSVDITNAINTKDRRNRVQAYVHILVADAFIGPKPAGQRCIFRDGDPSNCSVENLYYAGGPGMFGQVCQVEIDGPAVSQRVYGVWQNMRTRCRNPNDKGFHSYGGRGIKVEPVWDNFSAFLEWALANGYRPGLTLERLDVNGNYGPSNCTWLPSSEQAFNRRNTVYVTAWGERRRLTAWLNDPRCMVSDSTLRERLKRGVPPELAIGTKTGSLPVKRGPRKSPKYPVQLKEAA